MLEANEVKILLIGSYAVGYHGYPRATVDMDIWVSTTQDNAHKIFTVLKDFGFDVPGLSPELFLIEGQFIRMGVPPIRLEILTSISGVTFAECYAERVIDELDGV